MSKKYICQLQIKELRKMWKNKPCRTKIICQIVDTTLNNFHVEERKSGDGIVHKYLAFNKSVKPEDEQEYREMYSELLAVIRKHNRELKK